MTDHPNPSMDERLRTYAHQRRAQAGPPPALHAATRRLLQGEVNRVHGRRAAGPAVRRGWFAAWGAPLAWCASVAALVGLVTLVVRYKPADKPSQAASEAQNRLRPAAEPKTDSFRGGGAVSAAKPEPSPVAPTVPAAALTVNATSRTADRFEQGPTKATAAMVETVGIRFTQMDPRSNLRRNFQSPAKPEVLTSFQFVQDAGQVRVVDADGSVYTGQLATAVAGGAQQSKGQGTAGAPVESAPPSGVASFRSPAGGGSGTAAQAQTLVHGQTFRVIGTNVTLQQEVEFSGTFLLTDTRAGSRASVPVKAAPAPSRGTAGVRAGVRTNLPPSPAQFLLRGRAVIGGSNRFEIQARPTKP